MSTLEVALARIVALEARVAALESGASSASTGGGSSSSSGREEEALPDHLLEKPWADKTIARDPKQWKGPTQVNRRYSRAPAEWLLMAARNMEFKAQKGREEVPVRLNNKGKPWHESDTFEAKILRGWARRNADKPAPAPKPSSTSNDDAFDFGHNVKPGDDADDLEF